MADVRGVAEPPEDERRTSAYGRRATFTRLGTVLSPDDLPDERCGVTNPASARLRDGTLLLYPRLVADGNVSRVGLFRSRWTKDRVTFKRAGYALEPEAAYEKRSGRGGYGCEDPRVTYIDVLGRYLMAYCAYGPDGTRVAVASSQDGLRWERLGIVSFRVATHIYGDKDAAFFPDVVTSPSGIPSLGLLHRPTRHKSVQHGRALVPSILRLPPEERESIVIGYIPLARVQSDLRALLDVRETKAILRPERDFGAIKVGAGPPPVRVGDAWLLVYHGIDVMPGHENRDQPALQYRASYAILEGDRPDRIRYRAPEPFLSPELPQEKHGIVDHVVFPTGIDPRPDIGANVFDVYYGMADTSIGRGRLALHSS